MRIGRYWLTATCWVAVLCSPEIVQAAEPTAYQESGQWVASGEDGRCLLTRGFSNGSDHLTLQIETLPLSPSIDLVLKRSGQRSRALWLKAKIGFDDGKADVATHVLSFESRTSPEVIDRASIDRAELDRAIATETIVIDVAKEEPVRLPVQHIGEGLTLLDKCDRTIVASVGLNSNEVDAITTQAAPPQMLYRFDPRYFQDESNRDFADEAIVRYIIAADGTIERCGFIHQAQSANLNRSACENWGGQHFAPARDIDGKAIRGLYFERHRWVSKAVAGG